MLAAPAHVVAVLLALVAAVSAIPHATTRGGVVSREAGLSVDGGDDLVDGSGHAVKTDTVESHENLFAMVAEPMEKLAKLKGARFFHARPPPPAPVALLSHTPSSSSLHRPAAITVNLEPASGMQSASAAGLPALRFSSTLQISAAHKPASGAGELYLETPSGDLVHIHAADKTATLTRRSGSTFNIVESAKGQVRAASFAGALMTSGSFTMMSSGNLD